MLPYRLDITPRNLVAFFLVGAVVNSVAPVKTGICPQLIVTTFIFWTFWSFNPKNSLVYVVFEYW